MPPRKTTDMTPAEHIHAAKEALGPGYHVMATAHAMIAIAEYLALLTTPEHCINGTVAVVSPLDWKSGN